MARNIIIDEDGNAIEISSSGDLIMIDKAHYYRDKGLSFFIEDYKTLTSGEILEFVFTTPEKGQIALDYAYSTTDITTLDVYEGTSGITGGTELSPINAHRGSTKTSSATVIENPTEITSDGIEISGAKAGAKQQSGSYERGDDLILKPVTTYLYRFTSGANDNIVSFIGNWYEIPEK